LAKDIVMLASLLRGLQVLVVLVALLWLGGHLDAPVWQSLAVFWLFPSVVGSFIAIEIIVSWWVNRRDPAPRATARQLARAWALESVAMFRVFGWAQPWRSRAVPDRVAGAGFDGCGVILIHGFVCNRGLWTPWLQAFRDEGRVCVAVNLEPVFGSIDAYTACIEDAVTRVTAATGRPPVLVCHSMGGLAARAWLRAAGPGADARVRHVITLGTPHHGTWLGRFSPFLNGSQMRHQGEWARQLAADEPPGRAAKFTCWYANCDNIVFPASTATLAGADNRHAPGLPHVYLALDAGVRQSCMALIRAL
jgi:hypothetical protein